MRRRCSSVLAILTVLSTFAAIGCSQSSDSAADPPATGPDSLLPSEDITLTPETVVVDGQGGATLLSVAPDGTTFTLDGKADGVGDLVPGSILILTGLTVVKVVALAEEAGDVVVSTEPAAIGELIQDGEFEWSNVSPGAGTVHVWEPVAEDTEVTGEAAGGLEDIVYRTPTDGSGRPARLANTASIGQARGPLGKFSAGNYTFEQTVTTDDNGVTRIHIDVSRTGSLKMSAAIDASLSALITEGRMKVERSVLSVLEIKSNTWEGDASVVFEAAQGDELNGAKQQITKLPIKVDFPIVIYGIPFNLSVSAKLLLEPALTSKQSVIKGQASVTFGGSIGLAWDGGSVSGEGAMTSNAPDPISFIDGLGIGASAMVIAVQVPKVGFGLGWAKTNVGVFFDSVLSTGVTVSPSTSIVACYRADVNYTASVGIDARFLTPAGAVAVNLAKKPVYTQDWTFIGPNVPACTNTS